MAPGPSSHFLKFPVRRGGPAPDKSILEYSEREPDYVVDYHLPPSPRSSTA